jgi:membrane protease YdiL (CAAX protease family)
MSATSLRLLRSPWGAAAVYGVIWAGCAGFLALTGGAVLFAIPSLVIFGVVFTLLALALTRRTAAPAVPVERPRRESLALLAYMAAYALIAFGPLFTWLKAALPDGRIEQCAVLAYKLVVHVLLPAALVLAVGGRLRGLFDHGLGRRGVLVTLFVFCAGLMIIAALLNGTVGGLAGRGFPVPAIAGWVLVSWAWMSLEAGFNEEFLFRGLLQSRLTAWMNSAPLAIVVMAVIFALAHVPGYYLRGGEEIATQAKTLPQMIALAIAGIGPISILFGVLWHRTRSMLLVVLVHGAIDAMPYVDRMIRNWG